MLQKHGVDFSPTVEDEVEIRTACRYLGEKELAELIAAIRYQYRLQEVLAEAERVLSPSPSRSPSPSPPTSPSPTPTPDWKESNEAKQLVEQMMGDVEKLADEGRLIDLSNYEKAIKTYNEWVERCSVALGRIDIQMRKFGRDTGYKFDWDKHDPTWHRLVRDEKDDKQMFRLEVHSAVARLDYIKSRIRLDTRPPIRFP